MKTTPTLLHLSLSPRLRVLAFCLGSLILHPSCLLHADVVSDNPFIPEGWKPYSAPTATAPKAPPIPVNLELRGIDEWNGTKSYYLYDNVKRTGHWVNLHDQSADTPVLSVDESPDSTSVSVRINGKTERLALKKPDGKPLEIKGLAEAPKAAPAPPPGSAIPPPTGAPAPAGSSQGGPPGNFDRSQIPGYNASLAANDPANVAAMRSFFEARRNDRGSERATAPQAATPAAPAATTHAAPAADSKGSRDSRDRGRGR